MNFIEGKERRTLNSMEEGKDEGAERLNFALILGGEKWLTELRELSIHELFVYVPVRKKMRWLSEENVP